MIDEKINQLLKEIERELQSLDSARKQVESTVAAYAGLSDSTSSYVLSLNRITNEVQELIKLIGKDYTERTKNFQAQQKEIGDQAGRVLNAVENASMNVASKVEETISSMQKKLTICIVSSVATILIILGMHLLF